MNPIDRRRRAVLRAGAAACALPWAVPSGAAPGGLPTNVAHGDTSPEWEALRPKLFGSRHVEAAASQVQLIVPLRAAYGASVPVKIVSRVPQRPDLHVRRLVLVVDKNPSPVAATVELTPRLGQADFETRLRVDEYSHIRVVTELSNGELHTDSRYVKVSGGCSAPPNRDQLAHIGRTVVRLLAPADPGRPVAAEVTVAHPNDTGFELNQRTLHYFPPHFVRAIRMLYGADVVFDADLDFSISENPTLRFNFVPVPEERELRAEVVDSRDGQFSGALTVRAPA
jgi:sulfur-oxidizing protein SoxY